MDSKFILNKTNPKSKANILSKLLFTWMLKLFYKGTRKGLQIIDLYKALKCDESENLTNKLEINWDQELAYSKAKNRTPSLLKVIIKTFIWNYLIYGVILFIQFVILRPFQPVVLAYLIKLFNANSGDNTTAMYISSAIIVVLSMLNVFFLHHSEFGQSAIGMRIRIAVSSLIYRKILKLNQKALGQTATGEVVNLLSNEINRFDYVIGTLHYLWIMPFQTVVVTYLIWRQVGISALAGVLSMVLLSLPVQGYLGKLASYLRLNVAKRTDYRVKLMNEVISGIQVIKMYAWEKPFHETIKMARKSEIIYLTKTSYLRGVYLSCMVFIERTTLFLTIICYVLLGNVITADIVFSMAQFYNLLQLAMAIFYPNAISISAETWVAIKRLQNFLLLEEKEQPTIETVNDNQILLNNLVAGWVPENIALKNINLKIPSGTLCAIVGPVGAGKSSLLQLLLGELPTKSGTIKLGGNVSYSSQEPWLFAASVRSNILFGQEYNKLFYKEVVRVCALEKDFEQFPQGDKTLVGERGASLSGGQRARINLARAVYRQANIYLLDDPLSAVDTHVGKHLFQECILKYLKNKTRILVTHQLQYLKKADLIVVLNDGRIESQGTFEVLSKSSLDFTKLLVAADETAEKDQTTRQIHDRKQSLLSINSVRSELKGDEPKENEEEFQMSGISPFKEYVLASGNCCMILTLITILILGQAACSAADYWVTFWTQEEAMRHTEIIKNYDEIVFISNNLNETDKNEEYYNYYWYNSLTDEVIVNGENFNIIKTNIAIYIYTIIILLAIFITLIRSFAFFKMAMIASKNLHNRMFEALLRAPMRFFDTNPSGRVLNRFSKDMGTIDEQLPRVLIEALQILLVMTGILVMVTISNYYMIITIIVLGVVFLKIRSWFILTAKNVKHLEGITKSPVFSHLSSSLNGITTIRASSAEEMLKIQFDNHQDVHTSAWFLTIACRVAFGLWLDLICVLFVAVVTFSFVILNQFSEVNGSLVGLAISQSLILTGMLQYGMRQTAEVVNQLTSVERVLHYTRLEDEHAYDAISAKPASSSWPSKGLIEFRNLSLKYSENDPPVLKNLNVKFIPGSKIGIVGRTGAGKSSLISAIFRLAPIEGHIFIDGIDTKFIKLNDLRQKISIIPQEPVLFSASLRYNLDPFNEFNDNQLWSALEDVELKDAVESLDFVVSGGGSNFSLGQRQLICLARAILRNNKILVLDEATANVDPRTDSLIQATIRKNFRDCTVLTIAHRLNTIMDSDKVLVMDSGSIVEYDHPHILLQNLNGHFHKMVLQTGPNMTQQLKEISHNCYLNTIKEV